MGVLVGQIGGLGFSVTDALKTAITAPLKVASNPTVRSMTLTALKNNQYTQGYAQYADVADKAAWGTKGMPQPARRPPTQPMMPMPPQQFDDDGSPIPAGTTVQHGNILMIGGAVAAGLVLLLVLRK